ncbi:MAG: saccharopine dehydrogenase NADP-binding domain-containing protein [Alphaproteobacteria bacterium]|nr:saccharopine dehydrogenase NADP-binding domain-containing protein [Alphaproteobacteria bacterium]
MGEPSFDIILYGATGFTGRLVAVYLRDHAPEGVRWAIAGRNTDKLKAVAEAEGLDVPLVRADSADDASLDAMAAQTRVVITTVGPYARYGEPLVAACARLGTDYVDLTGETPWARDMIDRYHDTAKANGARITHFCGYDSVPSEVGALGLVRHFRDRHGQATGHVQGLLGGKGGVSGGTLHSMMDMAESGEIRRLARPFLLNPEGDIPEEVKARSRNLTSVRFDPDLGAWTAPFLMAAINTRAVRRSAALHAALGHPYGPLFSYNEAALLGRSAGRLQATMSAAGLGALTAMTSSPLGRKLLARLGPDPGEGPAKDAREKGWTRGLFYGTAEDGRRARLSFFGKGDPGYKFTSLLISQCALALVLDRDALVGGPDHGGVLTPASAIGSVLIERLERAGVEIKVEDL